jgi:hypothetical protein
MRNKYIPFRRKVASLRKTAEEILWKPDHEFNIKARTVAHVCDWLMGEEGHPLKREKPKKTEDE